MSDEARRTPEDREWVLVRRIWWIGGLLLILAWTSYVLFVPALIRSAYLGQSLPVLNRMITGQEIHSVEFYLARWGVVGANVASYLTVLLVLTTPLLFVSPRSAGRVRLGGGSLSTHSSTAWSWAIVGLPVLLTLYLFYMQPVAFVLFVHEDYWAEWATSFFFSAAFLYLLFAMVIDPTRRKWGYALLALAAFFVAGEEFSWGQRMLGVGSTRFFAENNVQREMNLHNLAPNPSSGLIAVAILVWVVGIGWAAKRAPYVSRWVERIGIPLPPRRLRPLFYACAAVLFLSHFPNLVPKITEIGELLFGCAVAALSLHIALESAARGTPKRALTIVSTGTLVTVVGISTVAFVSIAGARDAGPYLHAYAIDRYPERRLYAQAGEIFRYLEGHEDLLADTTLIEAARVLKASGDEDGAATMMELALERALEAREADAEAPEPARVVMVAHMLMEHEEEAEVARAVALGRDSLRLRSALTGRERADVHWSMAITRLKAGQVQAALREVEKACSLASGGTAMRIDRWTTLHLGDAAPNGCRGSLPSGD